MLSTTSWFTTVHGELLKHNIVIKRSHWSEVYIRIHYPFVTGLHNSCTTWSENHCMYSALGKTTGTLTCPRFLLPSSSFSCRKSLNAAGRTSRIVGLRILSCSRAQATFPFDLNSSSNTRSRANESSCSVERKSYEKRIL